MIQNKFLHYKTLEAFSADLSAGNIKPDSICFIADALTIYTHGKYYRCLSNDGESGETEPTIETYTHNILPFDGFENFIQSSDVRLEKHTVTVTKPPLAIMWEPKYTIVADRQSPETFYLKEDEIVNGVTETVYYANWEIIRSGIDPMSTLTQLIIPDADINKISDSNWYRREYRTGKIFYDRVNDVLYVYDYGVLSLRPITPVLVAGVDSNDNVIYPSNPTKGSTVIVPDLNKMVVFDGERWNDIRGGSSYDLANYNKELGQTVPSDIALSDDNKLVLRDRTTADGGKNVVTLRENPVTGKRHIATLTVAENAMLPNPVGAASEASKDNNIRITLNDVTYEVILSNTTSIAVDSGDTTNTINNLYTEGKYIAKRLSDNFLSNVYNMTTRKIRVPYTSEYINDDGVQKVIFTKCELTDEDVAESSIIIKKYGSSSFVTDSEMFTMSDEMTDNVTINVLTQDMITPPNINRTNTIFKVLIDYDLQGQEIDIPVGCILQMDGGSINNGYLRGNDTVCTDFSTIGAELIGTWRNNDNERIDNGVRKPRKKDVRLSTYFYVGQHGAVLNRKVDIYRYTKKVGMGDVNMVVSFEPKGILLQEDKALWFMPYQTIVYPLNDTTQIPTSITVNPQVYLGLEEINENGETVPVELVPDTAREEDGKYIVEWGNADLIGLGLFLRQGVDTLSFVKFVQYFSDIYNVNNTEGERTITKIKNTADFEARYVDRLKDLGFNFDTVYVMNEPSVVTYRADGEDTDTSKGSIYGSPERKAIVVNSVIEDLIEPMREKGYNVGVTLSQLYQYYNCIDEIFNALDEVGLNHYPTLSYDDDNLADTDDLTDYNVIGIRNVLQQNMKRKKMPLYITEGGCGYWKNALRAPMTTRMKCAADYGGDNRLDRDHSIAGHIFFKSLFKAAAALDAKKVNIWFPNNLETSNVEDVILDCFYK